LFNGGPIFLRMMHSFTCIANLRQVLGLQDYEQCHGRTEHGVTHNSQDQHGAAAHHKRCAAVLIFRIDKKISYTNPKRYVSRIRAEECRTAGSIPRYQTQGISMADQCTMLPILGMIPAKPKYLQNYNLATVLMRQGQLVPSVSS
jgi:hypothetical protein